MDASIEKGASLFEVVLNSYTITSMINTKRVCDLNLKKNMYAKTKAFVKYLEFWFV